MNRILFPRDALVAAFRRLRTPGTARLTFSLGLGVHGECRELLVVTSNHGRPAAHRMDVVLTDNLHLGETRIPADRRAMLFLGRGRWRGQAQGWLLNEQEDVERIDELVIVGPGLPCVPLVGANLDYTELRMGRSLDERWSRTAGAMGARHWRRLTELRVTVIGAGRSGSLLASILVRAGVRTVVIVDPDKLEISNLGESVGYTPAGVGRFKVEELVRFLRSLAPDVEVRSIPQSVTHISALHAIMGSDLVCMTVDQDGARLAATYLASLFHRPCLDLGTGITNQRERRQMGADVRYTWAGRCLGCTGGYRDVSGARRALSSADAELEAREAGRDWQSQRLGSLTSLNTLAVSAGVRMIEDFISGRLRQNGTWLRFEYDEQGRLSTTYPTVVRNDLAANGCVCRFAGLGQDGLAEVAAEIRRNGSTLTDAS